MSAAAFHHHPARRESADNGQGPHPITKEYYIGGQPVTRDEFAESQHARATRMAAAAPLATHWALNSFYN